MQSPHFEVVHRGVRWKARALSVAGTKLTVQFFDTRFEHISASVLEFSLWDARCLQVPDMTLESSVVEELRPWLRKQGCPWRIGWNRKTARPKQPKQDPRQQKLFEE
jgi:hypothetical protein